MSVKWDNAGLNKFKRVLNSSLKEYGKSLDSTIKELQVVPKDTGALEESQKIEMQGKDTIRISYSTPYAARLYFHPEYKFNRKKNKKARGMWLKFVFKGKKEVQKYADIIKRKI